MQDPMSMALIIALFGGLVVSVIALLKYYTIAYNLKHDTSKYVVLKDLFGRREELGKFLSLGMRGESLTIKILKEKDIVEEWAINLGERYSFQSVSIDYGKELEILTDFRQTDLRGREITPLIDAEILRIGLCNGFMAITERTTPLYERIDQLRTDLREREKELQEVIIDFDRERLEHIRELKMAYKELIDEVMQELILAPDLVKTKILKKRDEYASSIGQFRKVPPKREPSTRDSVSPNPVSRQEVAEDSRRSPLKIITKETEESR